MATSEVTFHKEMRWTDDECREYLAKMRWPDGPHCPKCGENSPYTITRKSRTKNIVKSLYKCRGCKRQFTATVGTIFEDSKIPLHKWFASIFLMCASKKGISAHQLHRQLGITYKSAWFMCHRIREAAKDKSFPKLTGTVEADETYMGGHRRRGHPTYHERIADEVQMGLRNKPPYQDRPTVFGIVERDGKARTIKVEDTKAATIRPIMREMIDLKKSRLITDGHPVYRGIKKYLPHEVVDHETEYVRDGDIHTQNIENYWSILKRGIYGVFHHVGEGYLPSYLHEFEFRFNRRKITDAERFAALMSQVQGRLLWYCRTPPQPQNPHA